MPHDPSTLENDLRNLQAAGLDESLLERLEACAEGSWTNLDPLELHFEQQLRAIKPSALSAPLMARMEATLSTVTYPPALPNIVNFPGSVPASRPSRRHWQSAAAAVALLGALAGWMLPPHRGGTPETRGASAQPAPRAANTRSALMPAGFNRGLSQASDEGVILQAGNKPHRLLKVVYREQATLRDREGRTYVVEQPRVEYIMVPTRTD